MTVSYNEIVENGESGVNSGGDSNVNNVYMWNVIERNNEDGVGYGTESQIHPWRTLIRCGSQSLFRDCRYAARASAQALTAILRGARRYRRSSRHRLR